MVTIREVLTLRRTAVQVDPLAIYEEIGLRSFGKGVFHKSPVPGSSLGDKRVFEIRVGDLLLSNVFAWEGAIAVASRADDGRIGSHRYMTYVPIDGRIDTNWAHYFFLSEQGLELIQKASPGSAGRNRTLGIQTFESLEIPLPPIEEQFASAARLDAALSRVDEIGHLATRQHVLDVALAEAAVRRLLDLGSKDGWGMRPLGEVAEINPSPTRGELPEEVAFVPMVAVDEVTGAIRSPEMRPATELKTGYKQFRRGDVIFARITPCMQNGKAAIVENLATDLAYGSTEFHVIRPTRHISAQWIHRIVRTSGFRAQAAERFTGTAGQQRVPAAFLEQVEIPVPPTREAQTAALARIAQILGLALELRSTRTYAATVRGALTPSFMNAEFNALR